MLNSRQAILLMAVSILVGVLIERGIADAGVDRSGKAGPEVADSSAGAIADAQITALVKGGLVTEFGIAARSIHVDTADSVVTLSGDIGTTLQHDIAVQIASDTAGVSDVVDAVTVREIAVDFWPAQSGGVHSLQGTI